MDINQCAIQVHFRFCHELVAVAKKKIGVIPKDDPEMLRILDAINFLEECYPCIKENRDERKGVATSMKTDST